MNLCEINKLEHLANCICAVHLWKSYFCTTFANSSILELEIQKVYFKFQDNFSMCALFLEIYPCYSIFA